MALKGSTNPVARVAKNYGGFKDVSCGSEKPSLGASLEGGNTTRPRNTDIAQW